MALVSNSVLVTTSKALVTRSDALVTSSFLFLVVRPGAPSSVPSSDAVSFILSSLFLIFGLWSRYVVEPRTDFFLAGLT